MKVLLTSAYFPPVQYMQAIVAHDTILIEQYENYQRQSFRNRCIVATANGAMPLSIPVCKQENHHTLIRDIRLDYSENWPHKHLYAIRSAYMNSPFYDYYIDDIAALFNKPETFLIDLNNKLLLTINELIGIERKVLLTESYVNSDVNDLYDLRNAFHPKSRYRSPEINYRRLEYYQVFSDKHGFIPNMSIIDLLFNEGPLSYQYLTQ